MAKEPEQPDLFEWKPKRNLLYRFWNSKKTFWIVYWLLFSPIILSDIALLLVFIINLENIYYDVKFIFLQNVLPTLLFLIVFDLKNPHIILRKLKSVYFWIIAVLLISLAYAHYRSVTSDLYDFLTENWIFSLGLLIVILVFLIIKRPPRLLQALKSKLFWLSFTSFALAISLSYQTEIVSLTNKFWLFTFGIGLVASSLLAIWKIPLWLNKSLNNKKGGDEQSPFDLEEKRLKLIDDSRKTVATIIGGLFVVIGAVFTYSNYELSYEGQVTNRFSTAVVLLKDEDSSVRIGGLYALERVAKDSPKDHSTIMEILTAFIRERSRMQREKFNSYKISDVNKNQSVTITQKEQLNDNGNGINKNTKNDNSSVKFEDLPAPVDVLTAVEIIQRRNQEEEVNFIFDLTYANLNKANLGGANLRYANFNNATLRYAIIFQAHLMLTTFWYADLRNANLSDTDLRYADLRYADLRYTFLKNTDFSYAFLGNTKLDNCRELAFSQISKAIIDENTSLPSHLESRRAELLELSKENLLERERHFQTGIP